MAYDVKITIEVREGYATSPQQVQKTVECKDFEAMNRLVGKILQPYLKEGSNGT